MIPASEISVAFARLPMTWWRRYPAEVGLPDGSALITLGAGILSRVSMVSFKVKRVCEKALSRKMRLAVSER